jgi:translation initiation factor 1
MNNDRLVYSTESGRICPSCNNPATKCTCKKKKATKQQSTYPNDGVVRIRREVKGRKGKTVTSIFGLTLEGDERKQFAKRLKQLCGTGGTVKEGIVVIQGDHRDTLLKEIQKDGYTVKLAGG